MAFKLIKTTGYEGNEMRILIVFCSLIFVGCAGNPATASSGFKYKTITPGSELTIIIDPDQGKFWPVIEGVFDVVSQPLESCERDSEFICFYQPGKKLTFGVPRQGLSGDEVWDINGLSFKVLKQLSTPNCGTNFVIESTEGKEPIALFTFNYGHGLQTIFYVDGVDTLEFEDDESVAAYKFYTLYFVDGPGFGGSGSCGQD